MVNNTTNVVKDVFNVLPNVLLTAEFTFSPPFQPRSAIISRIRSKTTTVSFREYPITVIIGDINGLKVTNDTFGHSAGDEIISSIANILKKAAKKNDIVSRWGGDEFAIILFKSDDETAEEYCNTVRENCAFESNGPVALTFLWDIQAYMT